jgi:crotonobetainyl-CoA:carnitine CoA-transferase CaiB-like acyl-CoA transferase
MLRRVFEPLKILELSTVLAGPLVGSFFAELGANIVKIENKKTNGDITRQWKNPLESKESNFSAYYSSVNYNKKLLFLDLTDESDYLIFKEELQSSDVVITNFQKKVATKLKMDIDSLFSIKSELIILQLNAYNYEDSRPGYDMVMQAETGYLSMSGISEDQPSKMPVAIIDILASHQMKEALLVGLIRKKEGALRQIIHVSLYQSGISALCFQAGNFLSTGYLPRPMGTQHPNIAPYGDIYQSRDKISFILAIGSNEQFAKLGETLICDEEFSNYFCSNEKRTKERNEMNREIQVYFDKYNWNEIEEKLSNSKIPFGKINGLDDVFENDLARAMVKPVDVGEGVVNYYMSNIAFEINDN